MGVSKLFLKEILEICNFITEIPKNKTKSKLNIIFLGDQDIRINYSELNKFKKTKIEFSPKKGNRSKKDLVELKDLFPIKNKKYLNIKTIDINGNPDLKLDITNFEEILNNSVLKNSISHFIDIGTIEHVIDPYKALCNINQLVEVDGFISHLVPCASYLNHGYYTISPQLLNDFYINNNYEILRFNTISYFGNYDSKLNLSFRIKYVHEYEIRGIRYMLNKGKYIMAINSFFRRIVLRFSKETYISFTAKKVSEKTSSQNLLYQKQYI